MLSSTLKWLVALGLGCAVVALPARAVPQDGIEKIARRGQINVGFSEDAPPFSMRGPDGNPVGYSVDLCNAIVERLRERVGQRLPVKYLPVPTDQLIRIVGSGGVDLMCAGTSDTAERRERLAFSTPIFVSQVKMMVRTRDGAPAAADLRGQTVAVMGRTTAEAAVREFSDKHGLDLRVSRVVGADAALSELRLGHSAAWARDEVLLIGTLLRQPDANQFAILPEPMSTEVIAIAMPRDLALQQLVGQTLSSLARDGTLQATYDKWFMRPFQGASAGLRLPVSMPLRAAFERLKQ